jgi:hypothetical protein
MALGEVEMIVTQYFLFLKIWVDMIRNGTYRAENLMRRAGRDEVGREVTVRTSLRQLLVDGPFGVLAIIAGQSHSIFDKT